VRDTHICDVSPDHLSHQHAVIEGGQKTCARCAAQGLGEGWNEEPNRTTLSQLQVDASPNSNALSVFQNMTDLQEPKSLEQGTDKAFKEASSQECVSEGGHGGGCHNSIGGDRYSWIDENDSSTLSIIRTTRSAS